MRTRDSLAAILTLALAAAGSAAVSLAPQSPQALRAQSAGFEALAHTVFGGHAGRGKTQQEQSR
jgi:hypothetical protein